MSNRKIRACRWSVGWAALPRANVILGARSVCLLYWRKNAVQNEMLCSWKTETDKNSQDYDILVFICLQRGCWIKYTYINENVCVFLGYYAVYSRTSLPTFRNNLSVPSSTVKKSKKKKRLLVEFLHLFKTGRIGCPETSVWNYHYKLRNIPEECRAYLIWGRSLKTLKV